MIRTIIRACLVVGLIASTMPAVLADARKDAKDLVSFGMTLAQKGLWKDAVSRWLRAVETDPKYASAWNNLAIGYEQLGNLDEARSAYEKAMMLDPPNQFIRSNYTQFREIYDRWNRRRGGSN